MFPLTSGVKWLRGVCAVETSILSWLLLLVAQWVCAVRLEGYHCKLWTVFLVSRAVGLQLLPDVRQSSKWTLGFLRRLLGDGSSLHRCHDGIIEVLSCLPDSCSYLILLDRALEKPPSGCSPILPGIPYLLDLLRTSTLIIA
jgi:hypothetical protein